MVDYRLVAFGAVLPVVELALPNASVLHTLLAPVVVLTVVMLTTIGRRLVRRRLLGIPIGMFFHLVLDGTWASASLFWWPAFGFSFAELAVPEASNIGFRLLLEVVGLGIAYAAYRRYGLDDSDKLDRFLKSGRLATEWE